VRVALTHALDRQRVIEDVLKGTARPISGPFYPTMWGADATIAPWPFDKDRAAALLDESGHKAKGGKRLALELLMSESARGPALDQTVAIFRNDLGSIGVELKVTYLPRNELVSRLILRNFDAALYSWNVDIPDPDPYVLLHSSQVAAGNYAGYSSGDVDKLLELGRSTTDRAKRRETYAQVHRLVHDDEPYTWLYSQQEHFAWSRRLRGVNPIDVSALPRWPGVTRWWIER
jgi:peptide/nickel transport system substrate-binding protein